MHAPHFRIYPPISGLLGGFHILATVKRVTLDTGGLMHFCVLIACLAITHHSSLESAWHEGSSSVFSLLYPQSLEQHIVLDSDPVPISFVLNCLLRWKAIPV